MPRRQHDYHFIYKTTNLVNGKFYVGMHSTSNLEDGYIGSGKYLWNSIRKYGKENFKIEILEWYTDRNSLKNREKELVNDELLKNSLCMNLKRGGNGGMGNEQHLILAARHLEYLRTDPDYKRRYSESLSNGNMKKWSKIPKEERNKFVPNWVGRKHREETKKKIGNANSLSQKGDKNSQFGKCWIHNEKTKESKSVKKEEIVNWLSNGWIKGRKNYKIPR